MTPPLILASGSVIRRQLLQSAGLVFEVHTAAIDERALEADLGEQKPADLARALAIAKAAHVSAQHPGAWVIGADQVLEHDGALLYKAAGREEANAKLARLQASTHHLIAAAALVRDGSCQWSTAESASLTMRALSAEDRAAYLDRAGDAATQSVGTYRLEELGASLFESIEGDYFTILGLPLLPLLAELRGLGIDPLKQDPTP